MKKKPTKAEWSDTKHLWRFMPKDANGNVAHILYARDLSDAEGALAKLEAHGELVAMLTKVMEHYDLDADLEVAIDDLLERLTKAEK